MDAQGNGAAQPQAWNDRPMRAAILTGRGSAAVVEAARPEPGPGEIRVRLEGCGICASNLGPWSGPDWMTYPTNPGELGHEGWGIVDALGEGAGASGLAPGDRVATLFQRSFAEFDCGPADQVVKLPAALGAGPFPGEPLGCAMNIFSRSDIRSGDTVAIVGAGFLGALLTQLAARAGARVIAISRRPFARDLARRLGAQETIALEDHHAIIETVGALTGGRLCERVIEATGKAWPLDLAGELTGERGRLIIAGYHQDAPRLINMQLWNWRGLDVVNAHERDPAVYRAGVERAIAAIMEGHLSLEGLITHTYPLSRLGDGLDATRDRPDGFLKAVVSFDER